MKNRKAFWLNALVYSLTAIIAIAVISWISGSFEGAERRQYIGAFLVGSFLFGKLANWLVLKIFSVDISK
jgi:hypothetical protein